MKRNWVFICLFACYVVFPMFRFAFRLNSYVVGFAKYNDSVGSEW